MGRNDTDGSGPKSGTRRTFLKTAGTVGIAGLAGCTGDGGDDTPTATSGGGEETDGGGGTVTTSSDIRGDEVHLLSQESSEPFQEYWDNLAAGFEDEYGASVRVEFIGETGSAQERIIQLLQAGEPPEIAQVVVPNAVSMGAQGALADHSETIELLEDRWGALPEQYLFEFDGRKTFIPAHQTIHSQWYREDVFEEVPNTWEKELAMAEAHDEGPGGTRGAFLSNVAELGEPTFSLFSRGWGNDAFVAGRDDNNEVQIVMDEEPYRSRWIEVFDHVKQLSAYSPDNTGITYTDLFEAMEDGSTYQLYLYGNRGKDTDTGADFLPDVRNTTVPVPESKYEENGRPSWANTTGYLQFAGSNTDAGQAFMEYWTREENYREFFTLNPVHLLPTQPGFIDDNAFRQELNDQLGPQWDFERDVANLIEMTRTSFDIPLETDPPNPFAGPLFTSFELGKIQRDVVINDVDIGTAIDNRAANMQEIIDNTSL